MHYLNVILSRTIGYICNIIHCTLARMGSIQYSNMVRLVYDIFKNEILIGYTFIYN